MDAPNSNPTSASMISASSGASDGALATYSRARDVSSSSLARRSYALSHARCAHLAACPARHPRPCAPIDSATSQGLKETTHAVLAGLTPREAKVLRMRFGIDMNTDHTLEEVGKQFDVTRERIRQIEAKALRKLRHPSRSEQLRSFIDAD